ncbi:hypothetical protein FJ364_01935 [Candidatus Dependentiae bacterium]|nr:hypothetical protein [Candidatus Dependentiae bacterium]
MINKNLALIALVLGFSVVANVEAAKSKKTVTVVAPEGTEEVATEKTVEATKATEATEEQQEAKEGYMSYASNKAAAGCTFVKDQFVNAPVRSTAITAGSALVLGLSIDAAVRRQNSVLGKLYAKLAARNQAKYDKVAELIAAKNS